jgi:hypothetical protein
MLVCGEDWRYHLPHLSLLVVRKAVVVMVRVLALVI